MSPLLLLLLLLPAFSFAHFLPADNHLLLCGAPSPLLLPPHRHFLPDSPLFPAQTTLTLPSPDPTSPLSRYARVFTAPSSYTFNQLSITPHILRLHFYPTPNLPASTFHVTLNSFTLLTNFSPHTPSLKEFIIPAGQTQLTLSFLPVNATAAFINAIELFSAPLDLISDVARLATPSRVEKFDGVKFLALETVYRLNVGGAKVTPFNDTLSRTWEAESGDGDGDEVRFSGRIMYRKYGASREVAPDSVYSSARVIRDVGGKLEWVLPVRGGFRYLVRMHFCDIASLALNEMYFDVYVNGNLAYEDFDLSVEAGQVLASPYYVDFAVDVGVEGVVNVTITRSKLSMETKIGGLLNGLEVMRMSNEVGSLDGEPPELLAMESPRKSITVGTFFGSVLCGVVFMSLCVGVFMVMVRVKSLVSGNSGGWSPLPVDAVEGNSIKMSEMLPGKFVYF